MHCSVVQSGEREKRKKENRERIRSTPRRVVYALFQLPPDNATEKGAGGLVVVSY